MFDGKIERLDTGSLTSPSSAAMKNGLIGGGMKKGGPGNITKPSL